MIKKFASIALAAAMALVLMVPAMASAKEEDSAIPEAGTGTSPTVASLNPSAISDYDKYALHSSGETDSAAITSSDILALCDCIKETTVDEHITRTYTSDTLINLIDDCKELTGISSLDNIVYIAYTTNDLKEVILAYSDSGIAEKMIYDPATDKAISITGDSALVYSNVRGDGGNGQRTAIIIAAAVCIIFMAAVIAAKRKRAQKQN